MTSICGDRIRQPSNTFNLIKSCPDTKARVGEWSSAHGIVRTPVFMPVGTQATVKTLTTQELDELGISIILGNAYHLYLRPGIDLIQKMGGLHHFMNWHKPLLTDSGGYQIFSLARLCEVTDEGVLFRSHIDGSQHFISPEKAIHIQELIGADIIMVLDECSAPSDNYHKIRKAMNRTHQWAALCQKAHNREDQALFAIVQGGFFQSLRKQSSEHLSGMDFDGYAIGGLSVGEAKETMYTISRDMASSLPINKPRYLMGVGAPEDIINTITHGIDMFDSVLPTRVARNGALYTWTGRQNIRKSTFSTMDVPFDPTCSCYTCRNYSAAYLNHLFKCEELLAYRLATIHNLAFMKTFLDKIRTSILNGTFLDFKQDFLSNYICTDEQSRLEQKRKRRIPTSMRYE